MSLARFRTRMLAMAALMPQPGDNDLVTMAGDKVFDSRLDPLQFADDPEQNDIPALSVYTDDDSAKLLNTAANNGPFHRTVSLVIEMVVGSFDTEVVDNERRIVFNVPYSTPELEAKLDLFEQQVRWALFDRAWRPASAIFRRFVVGFEEVNSHPSRDDQGNNRFASRRMVMTLRINDDCPLSYAFDDAAVSGMVDVVESDFPDCPWLAPMFTRMQAAPSYREVIGQLAGKGAPSIILPVLKRLGWQVDAIDPADPNLLAKLNKKTGPDGRIEVQGITEL